MNGPKRRKSSAKARAFSKAPASKERTGEMLVLKVLARGPEHGYGITLRVRQLSEDALRVEEGSLYPALQRMEQAGWIKPEWRPPEKNRRAKYYHLTAKGRKRLTQEQENWARVTEGVARVLRYA